MLHTDRRAFLAAAGAAALAGSLRGAGRAVRLGGPIFLKSDDPAIKRFLGATPGYGKAMGVDEKWMYNVVKQIENYGESFERNVGANTPLKLERGLNALWTNGGLMYSIPFR